MNGNNDDDAVTVGTFNQYKIDQGNLCKSYRSHIETKITNMENSIRWSVFLTGAVMTMFLTAVNWYLSLVK